MNDLSCQKKIRNILHLNDRVWGERERERASKRKWKMERGNTNAQMLDERKQNTGTVPS